ncbi:MAG: alpha/beta fold hydrolase [Pyrinomonadaceae bacterium]|nr:alpha/beta fold hydrolase [Pyrinomonadaceae bacterium]
MKRKVVIITVLSVLLTGILGIWFAGTILSAPAHQSIGNLPSDLAGRDVQFSSESGATIHGWFIAGKKGGGAIVLMHGVRANRLTMLDRARFLSHAGYSILLFDFQAHGESTGEHITFGYLESRDAQAAVSFLRENSRDEKIGVIGVSMGGAATLLASQPLGVNALVLEMVYPTLNQAISNRLTMRLGGWASALTPLLAWQLKPRLGVDVDVLRPIDHVGKISVPKLFIVGAEDRHTTVEESRQMFDAASAPKELWVVEGAQHVDLYPASKRDYERRVLDFFERHLKTADGNK